MCVLIRGGAGCHRLRALICDGRLWYKYYVCVAWTHAHTYIDEASYLWPPLFLSLLSRCVTSVQQQHPLPPARPLHDI